MRCLENGVNNAPEEGAQRHYIFSECPMFKSAPIGRAFNLEFACALELASIPEK